MAKWADPGHQPLDAFEAYRGCVWWMLHQWYRWRHWPTPSSVRARGRLSCRNSCKSISARWKTLSAGIPEGQRDIQRMISIKWSLSCSSSNEILYLCFRLLQLLDVTLKSCVILYLLLTGDTAAGWPPRHRRRVSQYVRVCVCVCGACVDGFRDAGRYKVDHKAAGPLKDSHRRSAAEMKSLEKSQQRQKCYYTPLLF